MNASSVTIPAQIRAGRALLDWSQETLASKSDVGLSSIRDIERQKRPTETGVVSKLRRALENGGVEFSAGTETAGPGVHLVGNRPNLIRRPTLVTEWDSVPFDVEWLGQRLSVLVSREVLEDLGRLTTATATVLLATFENHVGTILDAVAVAAKDPVNFDDRKRLRIKPKDVPGLN